MDHVLWLAYLVGFHVGSILPSHPAVPSLRQCFHHTRVQITSFDLFYVHFLFFSSDEFFFESITVDVCEVRNYTWVKQRPHAIRFNAFHEQIWNPVCQVQVVSTFCFVTGVVTHFEELLDVRMPSFQVYASSALTLATLIYGRNRRIHCFQPRND